MSAWTKDGAILIAEERGRQLMVEGWTPEHDDQWTEGQLLDAAICYLDDTGGEGTPAPRYDWPWDESWWKPSDDRVRNLVKAGALIAAEIDRLQRHEGE